MRIQEVSTKLTVRFYLLTNKRKEMKDQERQREILVSSEVKSF